MILVRLQRRPGTPGSLEMRCGASAFRRFFAIALPVVSLAAPSPARANSAFPDEFSVHLPLATTANPNLGHRILIGANFGLLVSDDDGATWRYSCEPYVTQGSSAALSQFAVNFYDLLADGSMLAASIELTRASVADPAGFACTWPASSGAVAGNAQISDIFADPVDPTKAWASIDQTNGSQLYLSTDGGRSFNTLVYDGTAGGQCGGSGKPRCYVVTGVESSKSSPGTLYMTTLATDGNSAQLLKFTEYGAGGVPESAGDLPNFPPLGQARILVVDPNDASKVYLRIIARLNDSIVVTSDGTASSAKQIVSVNGGFFSSFLLANDGSVYAGTADGILFTRPANATDPTAFTSKSGMPHFRCLGQRHDGTSKRIYACGDMFFDDFSLGYSDDGKTFMKVMQFADLLGPLQCPQVTNACALHWDRIQQVLCIGPYASNCLPDAGTGGAGGGNQRPGGSSHCSTLGAGTSALLLMLAFWLRMVGRARRDSNLKRTFTSIGPPE